MNIGNRYKLVSDLDAGGHGVVCLYQDLDLERDVAVKIIPPESSGKTVESDEVKLLSKVDSQNVVTVFDVYELNNHLVIVQEYLNGEPLDRIKGRITENKGLVIGYQIARGLRDIHSVDICHRDIKPKNMRFDGEGVLKIFDFGISREGVTHETLNGNSTISYAAPELFSLLNSDSAVEISTSYDIFSFGVCIWELMTGAIGAFHPYAKGYSGLPDFSPLFPNCSTEFIDALNKTLRENPTERPSAHELSLLFQMEILKDTHVARFVHAGRIYIVNKDNRKARVGYPDNYFDVEYNGYDFIILTQNGSVLFNNISKSNGDVVPEACVITLVDRKIFVSYLSSKPEVVI